MEDNVDSKEIPRDAKAIISILESMGVKEYEPRVVNMLMEFMHRYVSDILQDAQIYASHANKPAIDFDDIRLATQAKVNFGFTQPPPREVLLELAQSKNSITLPMISPEKQAKYGGVILPPEEYCLTASNYQVDPKRKSKREKVEGGNSKKEIENNQITPMEITSPTKPTNTPLPSSTNTFSTPPFIQQHKLLFNLSGDKKET